MAAIPRLTPSTSVIFRCKFFRVGLHEDFAHKGVFLVESGNRRNGKFVATALFGDRTCPTRIEVTADTEFLSLEALQSALEKLD